MIQVTHFSVPGPAGPKCFDHLVSSCSAHLAIYLWWLSFDAGVWGELGGLVGGLGTELPLGILQEKLNLEQGARPAGLLQSLVFTVLFISSRSLFVPFL